MYHRRLRKALVMLINLPFLLMLVYRCSPTYIGHELDTAGRERERWREQSGMRAWKPGRRGAGSRRRASRTTARSSPGCMSGTAGRPPAPASGWCATTRADQAYSVEVIATADDFSDADGVAILSYKQAIAKARERMVERAHVEAGEDGRKRPLTVAAAMDDYIAFLETNRRTAARRTLARPSVHPSEARPYRGCRAFHRSAAAVA